MHRNIERRLKLATILAVLSGYLALMTTFSYGTDILLVPLAAIALMPLGERLDRRFTFYRRVTTIVILLFIAVFFTMLRRFSLLDAVIALVMFIQVYSLVHRKDTKNYLHLFLMSFFLVLAAAVMSPRPDIAVVFVLFLLATILGLTLLEMFTAGAAASATPQWRAASGEILAPRKVRMLDLRFSALVAGITLGLFTFAGLLFVGGPRTEAGVFGAARIPDQTTTGLSSEMNLAQAGALNANTTPVMRVVFPEMNGGRFQGPMLWRVTALDAYTGDGWQHRGVVTTGYNTEELRRFKSESRLATREGIDRPAIDWPTVNYEIYLDRPPEIAVPLLQMPVMVKSSDEGSRVSFRWDIANDFSVVLGARGDSGVYIEATSELLRPSRDRLVNASSDFSRSMLPEDLAHLTQHDLLPETRALVERLTQDAPSPYEKILALQQHLQGNQFEYTRIIPQLPAENPVDEFVLRVRRGHCQFFASALALMIRSLGLPARLVSGYRGGNWTEGDQSYTVTEDMAHVWVEVYFPQIGWIVFDPSPMDLENDAFTVSMLTRAYNQYIMRARMLWLRNVVSFSRDRQGRELQNTASELVRSGLNTWEGLQSRERRISFGGALSGPVFFLFAASGALVLVWAGFAVRGWAGRRRTGRTPLSPDQRRAVQLRTLTARRLRRLGVAVDGCTAEELAEAARALRMNDAGAIPEILAVYNAARFGQHPLSHGEYKQWVNRLERLAAAKAVTGG